MSDNLTQDHVTTETDAGTDAVDEGIDLENVQVNEPDVGV